MKPLCYDLYAGLGGWSEAFLAEGYECIGYDIEAHDYGSGGYPGTLILRDVRSIHGSELKDAAVIVGSSPCQEFSYRAMPWKRAKALPPPYLGMELFNAQFRIQREASEAAGRHIPMVVENVRGAQKWVGRAQWNYGSFYLWGDVPALMPFPRRGAKLPGRSLSRGAAAKWGPNHMGTGVQIFGELAAIQAHVDDRDGVKQPGICGLRENGKGDKWFQGGAASHSSKSSSRKAASAMIAKIPFTLASWVARAYRPECELCRNLAP